MGAVLDLSGLSVELPPGAARHYAVESVSLTVSAGRTLCIVGESGSGKTMLAHAIPGLLRRSSVRIVAGTIRLHGADLVHMSEAQLRRLRGSRIGMIFQEPMNALDPLMPVGRQVEEVLEAHGWRRGASRRRRVAELLVAVGLTDTERIGGALPFQLSGGERQRAMIAGAIALDPDLLVADEPTTALDVVTQASILRLLKDLQDRLGMAMLFITHDMGVVAEIADDVAVMREGRIVESGSVDAVLARPEHPYTQDLIRAMPSYQPSDRPPPEPACELLRVTGLSRSFPARPGSLRRGERRYGVRGVDLSVGRGEIVGLVGESGAGKSTVGRCIAGLLKPDSGRMVFEGAALPAGRRPPLRMIFQDPYESLNPRHRVGRILKEELRACGVPPDEAGRRMAGALDMVGLGRAVADRYPHEFSGGQRQRIGIARALVSEPKLIVADEPVSALDLSVQDQILRLLVELRQRLGLAILFITHDLRVAGQICDRIAVMRRGELVECGPVHAVLTAPSHPYTGQLVGSVPGRERFVDFRKI